MYTLELAREADVQRCGEILDEGRAFQRAQGFVQWTEDYPNTNTIREDIQNRKGYVIRFDGPSPHICASTLTVSPPTGRSRAPGRRRSPMPWCIGWPLPTNSEAAGSRRLLSA